MNIKKGDTVKILYGKDSGKRGSVVAVNSKTNQVVVEGINVYKKHLKGDGKTRTSEIVNIEKPMPTSKVMLICPSCDKATRVTVKKTGKNIERVCKKCGKTFNDKKEEKVVEKKTTKKESVEKAKTVKKETKSKKETK